MKISRRAVLTLLFVVSLFLLLVIVPTSKYLGYALVASYLMFIAGFNGFMVLIEMNADRVEKGSLLILYGLVFQFFYMPMVFYPDGNMNDLAPLLKRNLDLYGQLIVMACAGAGGSIISMHADKTSKDKEPLPSGPIVIDNTRHMNDLITAVTRTGKEIQALNKLVMSLVGVIAVMAILLVVVAIAVFTHA